MNVYERMLALDPWNGDPDKIALNQLFIGIELGSSVSREHSAQWMREHYPVRIENTEIFHANCYAYAFGAPAAEGFLVCPYRSLVPLEYPQIKGGDFIWYNREGRPKHVGIVREDGMIRSQWGSFFVVEHPWSVVLDSYGTDVRFTRSQSLAPLG